MKKKVIQLMVIFIVALSTAFAQDIPQNQVPDVVISSFNKQFPKAMDVEWELQGDIYTVEFEIGWFNDYEAWFDTSGQLLKYTMEIYKNDLPKAILNDLRKHYKGYHIDDVKKIIEKGVETYKIEIEKYNDERKLYYNKEGKVI